MEKKQLLEIQQAMRDPSELRDRLLTVMYQNKMTSTMLARKIGLDVSGFLRFIKGNKKISSKTACIIIDYLVRLDALTK